MYTEYYHLRKQPFNNTPDPEFLYLSPSHEEALSAITYGVEERKGLIVTIGEVGVGKTTILRSYLDSIDKERVTCISIVNSNVSFHDLLTTLIRELEYSMDTDNDYAMMSFLKEKLEEEYSRDRRVVLMVDEADKMPVETLAKLGDLHNFETATGKLIQIILAAQPEFDQILVRNELRQVKQRIAIRTEIMPLTEKESLEYITHRLSKAAIDVNDPPVFKKGAVRMIIRKSGGIPRLINILCDNALITGFGYQKNPVDVKTIKEIIADFDITKQAPTAKWRTILQYALLLCATVIIIFQLVQIVIERPDKNPGIMSDQDRIVAGSEQADNRAAVQSEPQMKDLVSQESKLDALAGKRAAENKSPLLHEQESDSTRPESGETHPPDAAAGAESSQPVKGAIKVPEQDRSNSMATAQIVTDIDATPTIVEETEPAESKEDDAGLTKNNRPLAEESTTSTAHAEERQPVQSKFPITKTISPGNTLYSMTKETYGFVNTELLQWIQERNPHIKDIGKIEVGDRIIFPSLKDSLQKSHKR